MAVMTYSHKSFESWYVCCSCLHCDNVL